METSHEARKVWLTLRLTPVERARLAEHAKRRGVKVSEVVRQELGPILIEVSETASAGAGAAVHVR